MMNKTRPLVNTFIALCSVLALLVIFPALGGQALAADDEAASTNAEIALCDEGKPTAATADPAMLGKALLRFGRYPTLEELHGYSIAKVYDKEGTKVDLYDYKQMPDRKIRIMPVTILDPLVEFAQAMGFKRPPQLDWLPAHTLHIPQESTSTPRQNVQLPEEAIYADSAQYGQYVMIGDHLWIVFGSGNAQRLSTEVSWPVSYSTVMTLEDGTMKNIAEEPDNSACIPIPIK